MICEHGRRAEGLSDDACRAIDASNAPWAELPRPPDRSGPLGEIDQTREVPIGASRQAKPGKGGRMK
jgi:hypothetical protein